MILLYCLCFNFHLWCNMNKINVKFNLQEKKKDKSLILLSVTWEGNRIQRSAGISVETKYFDKGKGRIKRNHSNSMEVNKYFDDIESEIKTSYLTMKANQEAVTKQILKQKIDDIFNPKEPVAEKKKEFNFFKEYDKFIEARRKRQYVSFRTIQRYKTTQNHLKNFASSKRVKVTFDSFDEDFANDFVVYLIKKAKLVNSTAEAVVKNLKVFLNYAIEREITTNHSFKKSFKKAIQNFRLKTHNEQIALTNADIEKLTQYTTDNKLLEQTRDLFLIQIYSALRVSDLMRLTYDHISFKEGIIRIINKKTSEPVEIQLHNKLRKLLVKYEEKGLPKYSEPVYNRNIKTVCKEAGLTDKIIRTFHYGKDKIEKVYEKWELVRTHIARSTGITELVRRDVPDRKIIPTVGIKKQDTLNKYVHLANKESQEAVKNAWDRE
jgi:integrase